LESTNTWWFPYLKPEKIGKNISEVDETTPSIGSVLGMSNTRCDTLYTTAGQKWKDQLPINYKFSSVYGPTKSYISERCDSIYELYLKCLSFGLPVPFHAPDFCLFRSRTRQEPMHQSTLHYDKESKKCEKNNEPMPITMEVKNMFKNGSLQHQLEIFQTRIQFECTMADLKMHIQALQEKKAMSNHFTTCKEKDVCDQCHQKTCPIESFYDGLLPTWIDKFGRTM